jgi:TonB family protein
MDDAVSNALHARSAAPEGLKKMLLVSATAHIVLMTFAAVAPASLWQRSRDARPDAMTIDLGPSTGPETGGLTSMGPRAVQRAVADLPTVRPTHPPAAKTPDMVLPEAAPRVTAKTTPAPAIDDAPKDARGRKPIDGSEMLAGNAPAATAAQSTSVGLSTAVGGGTGAQVNVGDFCCPDYVATMLRSIHQHWTPGPATTTTTVMEFTIQRDGAITDVRRVRSSGNQMADFLAERALLAIRQLPPLPDAYTNPSLVVSLDFQLQR